MHVVAVIAFIILVAAIGGVTRAWLEERRDKRRL